jgi:hypothetical protein
MAQFVMIDQILIAERDAADALSDQGRDLMLDRFGRPVIHKQPANRPTKPIARSVAPSSIAPASEVILPPSNAAITFRPSTGAKPNRSGIHSVSIGALLSNRLSRFCKTTLADSLPRCMTRCEKCGAR